MSNFEHTKPGDILEVPDWVDGSVVGELGMEVATERTEAIGGAAITAAAYAESENQEPELTIEVDGRIFSQQELGITHPAEVFILTALPKIDTSVPVARKDWYDLGFETEVYGSRHASLFTERIHRVAIRLEESVKKTMIARTGGGGATRYWVPEPFLIGGAEVKPTIQHGNLENNFALRVKPNSRPELKVEIAGEAFGARVMRLHDKYEKFLIDLLPSLGGAPLSCRTALENGFLAEQADSSRRKKYSKTMPGFLANLNETSGQELLKRIGGKGDPRTRYLITESFSVDGRVVEESEDLPPEKVPAVTQPRLPAATKPTKNSSAKSPVEKAKAEPMPRALEVIINSLKDYIDPNTLPPLEEIIANGHGRAPAEIKKDPAVRLAIASGMDSREIEFDYRTGVIIPLRTGIFTEKFAREKTRYVNRGGTLVPLPELMEKVDLPMRGLDVATVSAIVCLPGNVVLATEREFLRLVLKNNPTAGPTVRALFNKIDASLATTQRLVEKASET